MLNADREFDAGYIAGYRAAFIGMEYAPNRKATAYTAGYDAGFADGIDCERPKFEIVFTRFMFMREITFIETRFKGE